MLKKTFDIINAKSVRWRYILSYFVIICIFICFAIVSVCMFFNIHKRELIRSNEYAMEMVGEQFESIYNDIQSIIYATSSEAIRPLLLQKDEDEFAQAERFAKISREIKKQCGNGEFFEQCFLYLGDCDTVINSSSVLVSKLYYEAYMKDCGVSYKKWMDIMKNDSKNSFVEIRDKKGDKRFVYICKKSIAPITNGDSVSLGFVLNRNKIKHINETIFEKCGGYVVSVGGSTLAVNFSQNSALDKLAPEKIYTKGKINYVKINNRECVLLSPGGGVGSKISLIIPESVFYKNLVDVILLQVIMLIVIAVVMVILSIKFTNIHFSPIKSIMNTLSREMRSDKKNEYEIITDMVKKVQSEQRFLNEKMTRQTRFLRENFIKRLVKGEYESDAALYDSLKLYNIELDGGSFCTAVFTLCDFDPLWLDSADSPEYYKSALIAMENIVSELINEKYTCYTVNLDDEIVCVINFQNSVSEDAFKSSVEDIYRYARGFIKENLGFTFKTAVGRIKDNILDVCVSYNEAISCIEYNLIYETENVFAEDIEPQYNDSLNTLLTKTNSLVKEMLRQERGEEHSTHITHLCEMCISLATTTPNLVNNILYGLTDSLIRQLLFLNDDDGQIRAFAEHIAEKYAFDGVKGFSEMKELITKLSEEVDTFLKKYKSEDYLKTRVDGYIRENYANPELCVRSIAEHFKLNPTYLTSSVRKSSGTGVLEMINKVRCEKSIELLIGSKKSVNDIASAVGCTSAHTYIRIFKKYYFCTPTEYRNNFGQGE